MAELIQMRRRIKVIETIKKITHAMRLIAMSTHSQLKNKQKPLLMYKQELESLFAKITRNLPDLKHPLLQPSSHAKKELIIIIGSQKGLCGSFNHYLFRFIDQKVPEWRKPYEIITIGTKAAEYAKKHSLQSRISLGAYSIRTITEVAKKLSAMVLNPNNPYRRVTFYNNRSHSFFTQKPTQSILLPFSITETSYSTEEYFWPEPPQAIFEDLVPQYIESSVYYFLFESLFAEQAARFLSMDSATRNAKGLLESTKLTYNKLRQAKITKELIELTGSFT